MDVRELIRHLRATGAHRRTVQRYRQWAAQHGLLTGPLPPLADLQALFVLGLWPAVGATVLLWPLPHQLRLQSQTHCTRPLQAR